LVLCPQFSLNCYVMEGFQVRSSKIIGKIPSDFEAFSLEPGKGRILLTCLFIDNNYYLSFI